MKLVKLLGIFLILILALGICLTTEMSADDLPTSIVVDIDIKPGSDTNSINLRSRGKVPFAVFSTADFDATQIDPLTVTLAGAPVVIKKNGSPMAFIEDVNDDGLPDIVFDVRADTLDLSDIFADAEGQTFGGTFFKGTDIIRVVP